MRRFILFSSIFFISTAAGWSQGYYETSGQTQVFTLTAGAKAGTTGTRSGRAFSTGKNTEIRVIAARGGVVVSLPLSLRGTAEVALFDIRGRQVFRLTGITGTSVCIESGSFAPGVYSMLIRASGTSCVRRVALNGRGK